MGKKMVALDNDHRLLLTSTIWFSGLISCTWGTLMFIVVPDCSVWKTAHTHTQHMALTLEASTSNLSKSSWLLKFSVPLPLKVTTREHSLERIFHSDLLFLKTKLQQIKTMNTAHPSSSLSHKSSNLDGPKKKKKKKEQETLGVGLGNSGYLTPLVYSAELTPWRPCSPGYWLVFEMP